MERPDSASPKTDSGMLMVLSAPRVQDAGAGGDVGTRDPLSGVKANTCSIERYGLLVQPW
jgi:hypothetical protein